MTETKPNLNLLPVLRALLRERSVSGAAALLGRSPSSVSESLSQLRTVLGDQLLVRVGAHLQLTARAASLVEPLEDAHERLQSLFRSGTFDPDTSARTFVIASSDFLINELGPDIINITTHARKMSLRFVDVAQGLTEKMAAREIDFALLPEFAIDDLAPAPLRFKRMFEIKLTALMSRDHPLAGKQTVTLQELRSYRHVGFQPDPVLLEGRRGRSPLSKGVNDPLVDFDIAVVVNQFLTIPRLLEDTDFVAILPDTMARAAVTGASVMAIPLAQPAGETALGIAWSPVYDGDEAHAWLRKMLTDRRAPASSGRKSEVGG